MKHTTKLTIMAAVMSLAAVQAWADQTNLVRNLNIQLVGYQQGDTTSTKNVTTTTVDKVQVGTADIIAALGTATGNSFSTAAQLVIVNPLPSGSVSIQVRDGGKSVDVSCFFIEAFLSATVGKSTANSKTGKSSGSNYSLQEFAFVDQGGYVPMALHYDVTGMAIENFSIPELPGPRSELSADVSGTGDSAGNLLILKGTISLSGQTLEVVPGDAGGPVT